ncbi:MAG: hypothetical protein HWD59_05670 [Coxiellaceae bacterium]|nr:MAG: hypothetical protein HWD59_05670 [Coxiellaceae bacterium]
MGLFLFLEENEKVTRQLFPNLDNFFKLTISQNLNVQDFMKEIRDDAAEKQK